MIVCPKCRSDNVDAGLFPYNPFWSLIRSWKYLGTFLLAVVAWLIAVTGLPAVGIPLFLACWVALLVLSIRNVQRYGWRRRVYHPTPCHCRHCGNDWIQMPKE